MGFWRDVIRTGKFLSRLAQTKNTPVDLENYFTMQFISTMLVAPNIHESNFNGENKNCVNWLCDTRSLSEIEQRGSNAFSNFSDESLPVGCK